ncbi:hypothetical protein J6590_017987 [Homalodisca vitripennis]|nr:hypothetical protein J6590_017987 [Homalodisca vitripennis]
MKVPYHPTMETHLPETSFQYHFEFTPGRIPQQNGSALSPRVRIVCSVQSKINGRRRGTLVITTQWRNDVWAQYSSRLGRLSLLAVFMLSLYPTPLSMLEYSLFNVLPTKLKY